MEFTHAVLKGVIWNDLEWWWSIARCLCDSWASCTMFNCIITVCWTDRFTHHRMLFSSQSLVSFQFITPSTYYQFHVFSMWLLRVCWSVVRFDSFWRAVFKNPVFTTRHILDCTCDCCTVQFCWYWVRFPSSRPIMRSVKKNAGSAGIP